MDYNDVAYCGKKNMDFRSRKKKWVLVLVSLLYALEQDTGLSEPVLPSEKKKKKQLRTVLSP